MTQQITEKVVASAESYLMAGALADIKNAETKLSVLINQLSFSAKNYMNKNVLRPIQKSLKELMNAVPDKQKDEMRRELVNDNTALQMEHMYNLLFALPQSKRDEAEAYIEQLQKE